QGAEDIPILNFSEVTFETSNGDVKSFDTEQYGRYREGDDEEEDEGEVCEKRLYRSMALGSEPESIEETDLQIFEDFYENMKRITLDKASLQKHHDDDDDNEDNANNSGKSIDNLAVDVRINKDDFKYATIPLHQDFTLDNGQTLEF